MILHRRLLMLLPVAIIVFTLACASTPEKELAKKVKKLRPGDSVDLFWVERNVDFSQFSTIQIPDFLDDKTADNPEWINEYTSEQIAMLLGQWKVFDLIDRTPKIAGSWTDLSLKGTITNFSTNSELRFIIEAECLLIDNRQNTIIALIKHKKTSIGIGTENTIRSLIDKFAKDIATFIKKQKL